MILLLNCGGIELLLYSHRGETMKIRTKIVTIIAVVFLVSFGILNGYWYFRVHNYYKSFVIMKDGKKISKDPLGSYSKILGDYSVSVEMPSYLIMEGNLSVCYVGNDDTMPFLIIWPKRNGKTIYGIGINSEYGVQQQLYVNEKGKLISEENSKDIVQEQEEVLRKNKKEVKKLLKIAHNTWDLD